MPSGKTLEEALKHRVGPLGSEIFDLFNAQQVELTVDKTNKVWVNVDGRCVLRVGHAEAVCLDDPERGQAVIKARPLKKGEL